MHDEGDERALSLKLGVAAMEAWVSGRAADLEAFARAVVLGRKGEAASEPFESARYACMDRAVRRARLGAGMHVEAALLREAPEVAIPSTRFDGLFAALEWAAQRLTSGEVDAVVVLEAMRAAQGSAAPGAGCWLGLARTSALPPEHDAAGALVLVPPAKDGVVCQIEAAARVNAAGADAVAWAAQLALGEAAVAAEAIGYVEVSARGGPAGEDAEIEGLALAYRAEAHAIAVGCFVSAVGGTPLDLFSLFRAALALDRRTVPGTSAWNGPRAPAVWTGSPFYVPESIRPWFPSPAHPRRHAAVSVTEKASASHVVLSERAVDAHAVSAIAPQKASRLFSIDARTPADLTQAIDRVSADFARGSVVPPPADAGATFTLVLAGSNPSDLASEAALARRGVPDALSSGIEWQTPRGSSFAPRPLGPDGKVAFVYPGALSAYPGVAADLFHDFPCIWDAAARRGVPLPQALADRSLYPRSLDPLRATAAGPMHADLVTMIHASIACGAVFTWALIEGLGLRPDVALGYSLGECTMLWALDAWSEAGDGLDALTSDPLFTDEIGGRQQAVRRYWESAGAPAGDGEPPWGQLVVLAAKDRVVRALEQESRVFLIAVNTAKEFVIGGHPRACRAFVERHRLEVVEMPGEVALHCEVIASKKKELRRFCTRPTHPVPRTTFHVNGSPIAPTAPELPDRLTAGLLRAIDFPRAVDRAYEGGVRVFVECGPGATVCRWIGENLKGRPHVVVPIDRRGVPAESSALKLEARLRAHRVPLAPGSP